MRGIRVLIVAKKEFGDLITSKKFLGFLIIYLLIFGFSTYQGASTFVRGYMQYAAYGGEKPHFIDVFGFFATGTVSFLGGLFGLIVGFDILTKEKENQTLRTLLSHPVFRDEIINGKVLAGLSVVSVVVFISITLAAGIMLAIGFPIDSTDIVQIGIFSIATVAYLFTFFAIGLFSSAISKTTVNSLLIAFALFFFLSFVVPFFSTPIAQALAGPQPAPPEIPVNAINSTPVAVSNPANSDWKYQEKEREWYERYKAIQDTINILSPTTNYYNLVLSLSGFEFFSSRDTSKNWVSLIVLPVIFFSLSYVKFLREEIT